MLKCPKCGFPVDESAVDCPFCGWKIAEPYTPPAVETAGKPSEAPASPVSSEELRRREQEAVEAANRELEEKRRAQQAAANAGSETPGPSAVGGTAGKPSGTPASPVSSEELRRREQEAVEAANRELEEKRRAQQASASVDREKLEAAKAELVQKAAQNEADAAQKHEKTRLWTLLLAVAIVLAAVGIIGNNIVKLSRTETVPIEEFQAWSTSSKVGDGVTFDFTGLENIYVLTSTTTYSSGTLKISTGTGTTTYKGYYLVTDGAGGKAILYKRISNAEDTVTPLTKSFPEIQTLNLGGEDYPYIPENTSIRACGTYRSAAVAMNSSSLNASSKQIYNQLSGYPFIDLDDTTVTREIQNEGARTWSAVLTVLTMIGIAGTIVFFVLRRKSAAAEKGFRNTAFRLRRMAQQLDQRP